LRGDDGRRFFCEPVVEDHHPFHVIALDRDSVGIEDQPLEIIVEDLFLYADARLLLQDVEKRLLVAELLRGAKKPMTAVATVATTQRVADGEQKLVETDAPMPSSP